MNSIEQTKQDEYRRQIRKHRQDMQRLIALLDTDKEVIQQFDIDLLNNIQMHVDGL